MSTGRNHFSTAVLPQLRKVSGLVCPTCKGNYTGSRTIEHPIYSGMVIEETYCIGCARLVREDEYTVTQSDLRPQFVGLA